MGLHVQHFHMACVSCMMTCKPPGSHDSFRVMISLALLWVWLTFMWTHFLVYWLMQRYVLWRALCYMHYCCTAIAQSQYKVSWCKEAWESDSLAAPNQSFVHWMLLRHRHWQYLLGWRCCKNHAWCVIKHTWHVGMAAGTFEMCRPLPVWLISSSLCWLIDLKLLCSHEHSQKHWLSWQFHGKQPHTSITATHVTS